jgi:hypothetical protein
VIPFFAFPREVRRILYTTNAIEALNSKLRRVRARGHFPHDEAALKLIFLVLNRSEKEWKMPPREWAAAKAQMAVMFGERFSKAMTAREGNARPPHEIHDSLIEPITPVGAAVGSHMRTSHLVRSEHIWSPRPPGQIFR